MIARLRGHGGRRPLRDQRGFTLVELLIGLAAGMVVVTGLFTVLDVSLAQTTRTFSRIDATQRARTALDQIGQEMRSACLENRIVPIRWQGSTTTSVSFWSQYGNAVSLTPVMHKIVYSTADKTVIDYTYPVVSGAEPSTWVPDTTPSPATGRTLLTNVDQSPGVAMFRYFQTTSSGQVEVTPSGSSTLTEAQAEKVSEVRMTMVVRPAGGSNEKSSLVPNTVTNSVVLRLTPFPNPGGTNGTDFDPCG